MDFNDQEDKQNSDREQPEQMDVMDNEILSAQEKIELGLVTSTFQSPQQVPLSTSLSVESVGMCLIWS